jgi:hypothetical protein
MDAQEASLNRAKTLRWNKTKQRKILEDKIFKLFSTDLGKEVFMGLKEATFTGNSDTQLELNLREGERRYMRYIQNILELNGDIE